MLEIAAALSTGKKVLGHDPGKRVRILYVDFENDPRGDVRTRLQDMGYEPGDLDYLDYLSFPSLPYLDSESGASALLAAVEAYLPELVVIDTISRAVQGEENDNNTWLNLYRYTGLALKQAKVAMIRLDHTGKDETKGQRGGSAKSGDVDAIWKLTTVVKDERFQLVCTEARFTIDAKELTLLRHDYPLHHSLQDSAPVDDREAKILHVMDLANRDNRPVEGRDKLIAWAVGRGLQYRKDIYEEVVKRRKNSAGLAFDPDATRPNAGQKPPGNGQGSESENLPQTCPRQLMEMVIPPCQTCPRCLGAGRGQGALLNLPRVAAPSIGVLRGQGQLRNPEMNRAPSAGNRSAGRWFAEVSPSMCLSVRR
jgi:hypothetical protein